jgi:hypothetical protein
VLFEVEHLGGEFVGEPEVVGVEQGEEGARGGGGAAVPGGADAVVTPVRVGEDLDGQGVLGSGPGAGGSKGIVVRAIVANEDFDFVAAGLLAGDGIEAATDIGGAIVEGDDDGDASFDWRRGWREGGVGGGGSRGEPVQRVLPEAGEFLLEFIDPAAEACESIRIRGGTVHGYRGVGGSS